MFRNQLYSGLLRKIVAELEMKIMITQADSEDRAKRKVALVDRSCVRGNPKTYWRIECGRIMVLGDTLQSI